MDNHPTLQELTQAAYDLGPSPDHVFWCGDCLGVLERMREECETFRREHTPKPEERGFLARLFLRKSR